VTRSRGARRHVREPGIAEVRKAEADGRWAAAYESQKNAVVPEELAALLAEDAHAKRAFEALARTDRYLLILPLLKARTPEARRRHLEKAVATLEEAGAGAESLPPTTAKAGAARPSDRTRDAKSTAPRRRST
jgi:uncharacterized protein YdeI (YjbR/CyaY-like superfamily)